ncbi:FAD-dependent oxidoreductase [Acidovorax sp. RAC01]|uniref:FAD-dependent oxidoreductase n=1 Tax=Acidovorax sp. RAC01 TaxID=1842533 RepID=UPI00083E8F7B|nr:FAD-dependent oxidoreductase [Acidovorax sp. RAC01]AOG22315.1 pyridine nucleotide-disulfide oxidoreductase family protein [Acidovorax sp. RAC01]
MKIAIVGAGITGVTTAYELARDGHDTTVFEQRGAAAEEASFATGSLLAPLLTSPWALPGFGQPLRLWGAQSSLRMSGGMSLPHLVWLRRWRQASRRNTAPAVGLEALARYSQTRLEAIAALHDLDFEGTTGRLLLLRTEAELAAIQPALQTLRDTGNAVHEITPEAARKLEPGLCPDTPLAAALHLPAASAGNCRLFGQLLRQGIQGSGVTFEFNATVERISTNPVAITLRGDDGPRRFDAVVLCTGAAPATLMAPLGLALPVAAVHGYTVSAPLREATHAPLASVIDVAQQVSITRLGQRVRIAGGAELAGPGAEHHAPTLQRLYRTLNDWFPGGAQLSTGLQIWRGARVAMPDGAPVIGASGVPGVWLNLAHGGNGWALACGSARAVADLVAQRAPEVSLDGLGIRRF